MTFTNGDGHTNPLDVAERLVMPVGKTILDSANDRYIQTLEAAISDTEHESTRIEYLHHLSLAKDLRSEIELGVSEEQLKRKLADEHMRYESAYLPGREAEFVGRAFGDIRRAIGLT